MGDEVFERLSVSLRDEIDLETINDPAPMTPMPEFLRSTRLDSVTILRNGRHRYTFAITANEIGEMSIRCFARPLFSISRCTRLSSRARLPDDDRDQIRLISLKDPFASRVTEQLKGRINCRGIAGKNKSIN